MKEFFCKTGNSYVIPNVHNGNADSEHNCRHAGDLLGNRCSSCHKCVVIGILYMYINTPHKTR